MPKEIITEVEGQKLKLTNIDKIIYPSIDFTKAQFIQYYLEISPYILPHLQLRPLTLIRYPDGVNGKKFYSKSKPKWTPDWIQSFKIEHDTKTIDYLYIHDKASLTWLSNLVSLELHPTQFKVTNDLKPDHFIFDLDPDEDMQFDEIKATAFEIKEFLESYGYNSFVKTSGGKGLHLYVPIHPKWTYDISTQAVKELGKEFIQTNIDKYTLQVSKGKRKGKILIDIYRNHLGNTCVAPYSTRGKKGGPISMPVSWDNLGKIISAQDYNLTNFKTYLNAHGDAWAEWKQYAVTLHTQRTKTAKGKILNDIKPSSKENPTKPLDPRIEPYIKKRDFDKTSEPLDEQVILDRKDEFVVQMHDATNLHYDLRLEHEGTLWSWAIPKGLPSEEGVKRLAIQTEDHPVKYLDFEGSIPKGSYGGGEMWIMDKGKVKWSSKKAGKSLKFTLVSPLIAAEYKLYKTKGNQWLCEMLYGLTNPVDYKPMLAEAAKGIPKSKGYTYEVKWDGIRAFIILKNDKIQILSRSGRDITTQFPEFQISEKFEIESGVFDAEIVVLDSEGKPRFHDVISRMHNKKKLSKTSNKPATCYVFDVLNVDGINITDFTFKKRREILKAVLKKGNTIRISNLFDDGNLLFKAIQAKGMEGVMAKKLDAQYFSGQRSRGWLKIKCRTDDEAFIIGYTKGKGGRNDVFGSLHLAKIDGDKITYMGKVGTGFDMKKLKELSTIIFKIKETAKPIDQAIEEPQNTVWIEPKVKCAITYASMSSNDTYREPVFRKLIE